MRACAELCDAVYETRTPDPSVRSREGMLPEGFTIVIVLKGQPASPGVAMGRATVINSKEDIARVKEGEVIISRTASPHLAMVMGKACAIAAEYGSQGAAASSFARECGIPAVVGVADLTKAVCNGDLVRIDGTKGTVEIVRHTR